MQTACPIREPPLRRAGLGAAPTSARCREWHLDDLYEGMDSPAFAADLGSARARGQAFARTMARASSPRSPRDARRRREARRGGAGLRGAAGPARPHHVLRLASLRWRHDRSGAREILRRRAGEDHRRSRPIFCSSSSNSTGSTTRRSKTAMPRTRARRTTGRGSRISARRSRTSSTTRSSNCSTRSR